MEFQDHLPARDARLPATHEMLILKERVRRFASTDPVVLAWARQCVDNLSEEDQTTEDMIRLSATVLDLVLDMDLHARSEVRRALPEQWRAGL